MTIQIKIEEFKPFPKIKRLFRDIVITEKIDGTNASVTITEDGQLIAGSRTRFITPATDNYGFARWVDENQEELYKLGIGTHFGEWWGRGIQRSYGLQERRFSLFNVAKWSEDAVRPSCCHVVPTLLKGEFDSDTIKRALEALTINGSVAAPGFKDPEGICIYHTASNHLYKYTTDDSHKKAEEASGEAAEGES